MKTLFQLRSAATGLFCLMSAGIAHASVESTLSNVQDKLLGTLLPAVAILGLGMAGISFAMGHENAKKHMIYAVIGTIIGFAAPSIIQMAQSIAH